MYPSQSISSCRCAHYTHLEALPSVKESILGLFLFSAALAFTRSLLLALDVFRKEGLYITVCYATEGHEAFKNARWTHTGALRQMPLELKRIQSWLRPCKENQNTTFHLYI